MRNAKIRESLGLLRKCGLKVSGIVDVGIQHSTESAFAGGLTGAAQVHPPFHGVVPSGSDVVFSTRFKRTEAMQVFTAYKGTRVEWVYTNRRGICVAVQGRHSLVRCDLECESQVGDVMLAQCVTLTVSHWPRPG
jgi:hypothetical protein